MSIPAQCVRCRSQFTLPDALAGKKVKCPKCSSHFQVPELSVEVTPPPVAPRRSVAAPPAPPLSARQEEGWSTPEWDDHYEDERPENAGLPFPDAPPPDSEQAAVYRQQPLSFGTIADFAMDAGMITYALQWAAAFILASVIAGAISMSGLYTISVLFEAVAVAVCGLGLVSGLSRLVALKLDHRKTYASEGWSLFGQRWIDLGLIFAVWAGALLAVGIVFGALAGASRIPVVGGILGGALLIPTFAMILITLSMLVNLYLLPIIIGVENCSISEAVKSLFRVATGNGIALYVRYLNALKSLFPFMIFTGLLTAGALAGATVICGGEKFAAEAMIGGFSPRVLLFSLSISTIIAIYMAFVIVYMTVSFVMIYAESSKRTIVY